MDKFALVSDAKGYAMGYWDTSALMLWDYARRYTLADNFFHAAFGGSFLNHFWLVCACTPVYPNATEKIVAKLDGAGKMVKEGTFSYHHQPFAFFKRFQKGAPDRARHLKDLRDFLADIQKGTLPAVVFYKPRRGINQHPSASDVASSDRHVGEILQKLEKSPQWARMAVIITYDENGGFWDHVAPPTRDRWGPGTRVPAIIVSPFAKRGFVDHTPYDTTSVLKLIETRFGLAPLTEADAKANTMVAAFQF